MTIQIIDTHQHLWDLTQLKLPWVADVEPLNKSFLTDDYLAYTSQNDESDFDYAIEQTLYMEVDVASEDIEKEIALISKLCHDPSTPTTGLIPSCRPGSTEFQNSVDIAKETKEIKGFRRVLHVEETPPGFCLDPAFVKDIQMLGQIDMPFDICIRREELSDVVKLAQQCPDTQFVLDHCGNADARMSEKEFNRWASDVAVIANCNNVACKVSGFVWTIQTNEWTYEKEIEPILRVVFDSFGEDRVLFGGDWPVCTLSKLSFQQWLNSIYRFASQQGNGTVEKLFSKNAQRIYQV